VPCSQSRTHGTLRDTFLGHLAQANDRLTTNPHENDLDQQRTTHDGEEGELPGALVQVMPASANSRGTEEVCSESPTARMLFRQFQAA